MLCEKWVERVVKKMIDMVSRSEILERLKSLELNQTDDKVIKGIHAAAFVVENAPDFTGYINKGGTADET